MVIQDAEAYQEIIDLLDTIKQVNSAATPFDIGEGQTVEEAFEVVDEVLKEKRRSS